MSETSMIQQLVREAAAKKLLFLPHAIRQMNKPDRMITATEVREVVRQIEVVEDYPEDPRGHSCLLRGEVSFDRIVHVVCSPKEDYLAIITVEREHHDLFSLSRRTPPGNCNLYR